MFVGGDSLIYPTKKKENMAFSNRTLTLTFLGAEFATGLEPGGCGCCSGGERRGERGRSQKKKKKEKKREGEQNVRHWSFPAGHPRQY